MAATSVSRVGKNLLKSEPRGFDVKVSMEDGSAYTNGIVPAFTLVGVKPDGYGEKAAGNIAYTLVGVTTAEHDVSDDAADGDTEIGVRHGCVVKLNASGLTIANVGDPVFISDNQTVTTTDPVDATPQIGHITEVISATECFVYLAPLIVNP